MMGGDFAPLEAVLGIKQLRDEGQGMSEGGRVTSDKRQVTRDKGRGMREKGLVTRDKGRVATESWC